VCNYNNKKGKVLSSQGKKQTEASLSSGSNSTNLYVKKVVFGENNRALLKITNVFVYYSGTGKDISNIPTNLDSIQFGFKQFV
jgi:hypothetical protein